MLQAGPIRSFSGVSELAEPMKIADALSRNKVPDFHPPPSQKKKEERGRGGDRRGGEVGVRRKQVRAQFLLVVLQAQPQIETFYQQKFDECYTSRMART